MCIFKDVFLKIHEKKNNNVVFAVLRAIRVQHKWKCIPPDCLDENVAAGVNFLKLTEKGSDPCILKSISNNICLNSWDVVCRVCFILSLDE